MEIPHIRNPMQLNKNDISMREKKKERGNPEKFQYLAREKKALREYRD